MTRLPWVWWRGRDWLVLGAAVILGAVLFMFLGDRTWLGSWKMALDWASGTVILVGPLVAGFTAWHYARYRALGLNELVAQTPRGGAAWFQPALAAWSVSVACTFGCAGAVTSLARANGSRADWSQIIVLVLAFSVLAAQVMIGAYVGTRFPGPWAAPVSSILTFGLGTLSSVGVIPGTFRTGGVTSTLVGQAYVPLAIASQALVAVALAAALTYGVRRAVLPVTHPGLVIVLALAVVAGGVAWVTGAATAERYRYVATDLTCDGSEPQVCMATETTRPLRRVGSALRAMARPLDDIGVELPDTWVQDIPGRTPVANAGQLIFFDNSEASAGFDNQALALSLASPADCADLRSQRPNFVALEAKSLLVQWLLSANGRQTALDPRSSAGQWLVSTDARDWVRETYPLFATCDLENVTVPSAASLDVP